MCACVVGWLISVCDCVRVMESGLNAHPTGCTGPLPPPRVCHVCPYQRQCMCSGGPYHRHAYAPCHVQVSFPDGQVRPCLAPVASLINHGACPHIVRFSTVEPSSNYLQLHTFRPAAAGEQVRGVHGCRSLCL